MANLRLRVNIFMDEPIGDAELVARVHPVGDKERPMPEGASGFLVPAGDKTDEYSTIDLPDGRYALEVALPSGETLASQFEMTGSEVELSLEGESSPHEWLGFQYLAGNVGSDVGEGGANLVLQSVGAMDSPAQVSFLSDALDRGRDVLPAIREWSERSEAPVLEWGVVETAATENPWQWEWLSRAIELPDDARENVDAIRSVSGRWTPVGESTFEDPHVRVFRFQSQGPMRYGGDPITLDLPTVEPGKSRAFVLGSSARSVRLMSAPVPWFDLSYEPKEADFEILSIEGSEGLTAVVRDESQAAILGYLKTGSLQNARMLVDRAHDMLFEKVSNPLGAALGGYVLIAANVRDRDKTWHAWIRNLREWFPWMPDGAIEHGWLLLTRQQSDGDVEKALEAFLEGWRRGLPFYSMGVRWLLDGLTSFASDPGFESRRDEILGYLEPVRRVASRTNFQQTFTSVRLTRR